MKIRQKKRAARRLSGAEGQKALFILFVAAALACVYAALKYGQV